MIELDPFGRREMTKCFICGKESKYNHSLHKTTPLAKPVRVYYVHDYYGCDTGCCGHMLHVEYENGEIEDGQFDFIHDKEMLDGMAKELAAEIGTVVDTESCDFRDF